MTGSRPDRGDLLSRWIDHCERRRRVRHAAWERSLRPRDCLLTLMLGSLSASLSLLALIATLAGMTAAPLERWTEPHVLQTHGLAPRFRGVIFTPSRFSAGLLAIAIATGMAGVLISRRRGRLSWLSLSGVILAVLAVFLGAGHLIGAEWFQ